MLFPPEFSSVMTLDKHVVIRQRRCKQILAYDRRRLNPNLRAAEVLLKLAARNGYIHRQQAFHIVTQFNQAQKTVLLC